MPSITITEIRPNVNTPFFNDDPRFVEMADAVLVQYQQNGITGSIETSADGLTRTYTRTFPENKILTFKELYNAHLQEVTQYLQTATDNTFNNVVTKEFDSARTFEIYSGMITP
jgi:hypothetical protein